MERRKAALLRVGSLNRPRYVPDQGDVLIVTDKGTCIKAIAENAGFR